MHCDKMAGVNMLKLDQLRARAPRFSRRRFLAMGGAALFCFATLNAGAVLAWYEPKRGSAERAEILDALRPAIEAEMRGPVEFVIQEFRASDGWAFVIADPQRPGGAAIAMNETGYAAVASTSSESFSYAAKPLMKPNIRSTSSGPAERTEILIQQSAL
jgi:hypothetical protein